MSNELNAIAELLNSEVQYRIEGTNNIPYIEFVHNNNEDLEIIERSITDELKHYAYLLKFIDLTTKIVEFSEKGKLLKYNIIISHNGTDYTSDEMEDTHEDITNFFNLLKDTLTYVKLDIDGNATLFKENVLANSIITLKILK